MVCFHAKWFVFMPGAAAFSGLTKGDPIGMLIISQRRPRKGLIGGPTQGLIGVPTKGGNTRSYKRINRRACHMINHLIN